MREFYITIDEALQKGLRPEIRMPRGSPYLHECSSLRIGKKALEGIPFLEDIVSFQVTDGLGHFMHYNWPFPQFLKQESWKILVVRDHINERDMVYSFDDSYAITEVFAIDELIYGQGTLMEMADFGEYTFLTNGVIMLYWDPTLGAWDNAVAIATIPMMRTVCNFKGQMIGGCVLSNWPVADPQCDETYIVWSNIGDVSFVPNRRNEAGYRRDPFGGEVYHVRRLGDDVIVYTSNGITRMFPVSSPAATFGFEELHGVGVLNRGAVNGDLNQHLVIDRDYVVWKVTKEGLKELGYAEYIEGLDAEYGAGIPRNVIVNFNPYKRDFYISDGTKSLLLSPYGMTNYPDPVSAVWYDEVNWHELCGLPETPDEENYPLIVSDIIDMGYRAQKTIYTVELGGSALINPTVAIDWRMHPLVNFERTDFVPVNNEGIATLIISGTEFRICVKSDFFVQAIDFSSSLDYITARWKMTDLRGLRGIYAAPPRGQEA